MSRLPIRERPPTIYDKAWLEKLLSDLELAIPPRRQWETYVRVPLTQNSGTIPIFTARAPTVVRAVLVYSPVTIAASTDLFTLLDVRISGGASILPNQTELSTSDGFQADTIRVIGLSDEDAEEGQGVVALERGQTIIIRFRHYTSTTSTGPVITTTTSSEEEEEREQGGDPPEEVGALATELYFQVDREGA